MVMWLVDGWWVYGTPSSISLSSRRRLLLPAVCMCMMAVPVVQQGSSGNEAARLCCRQAAGRQEAVGQHTDIAISCRHGSVHAVSYMYGMPFPGCSHSLARINHRYLLCAQLTGVIITAFSQCLDCAPTLPSLLVRLMIEQAPPPCLPAHRLKLAASLCLPR